MKALKLILASFIFYINPSLSQDIVGCTNSLAINYNEIANVEDDSCEYVQVECDENQIGFVVYMEDSYGDGWNGNEYYLINTLGDTVKSGTLEDGYSEQDTICVVNSCYAIFVDGGSWQSEVSWSISNEYSGYSTNFSYGVDTVVLLYSELNDNCPEIGCTDFNALNYDSESVIDDLNCEYELSEFCEDAIELNLEAPFGGRLNEQIWYTFTIDSPQFVSIEASPAPNNWYWGNIEIYTSCDSSYLALEQGLFESGTYFFSVNNPSEWSIGSDYIVTISVENVLEGCTDSTYLEYHTQGFVADYNDGSCETLVIEGCTNEEATNYSNTANIDDGSCYSLYPIVDTNFLAYLQETYPQCIMNDSLNTLATSGIVEVNIGTQYYWQELDYNIYSIDGVQYFFDLEILNVGGNNLTNLPTLPNGLKTFKCWQNNLIALPELPDSLISLECSFNYFTTLPELPNNLTTLDCQNNNLSVLPLLPSGLTTLNCSNNDLSALPELPNSLTALNCLINDLTALPELPNGLTTLDCQINNLSALPELPNSLTALNCRNNYNLTALPELPNSLNALVCSNNDLSALPELPNSLTTLNCHGNNLTTLPELPNGITTLDCQINNLSTLPELPNSLTVLNCSNNDLKLIPNISVNLSSLSINNNPIQCVGTYPYFYESELGQYPNCNNCTDSTAVNYVEGALYNDGTCMYNIAASFEVDTSLVVSVVSIDDEASLQLNNSFAQELEDGFLIGGFYNNEQGELVCAGYTTWNSNGGNSISLYGDNPITPQVDGLQEGEALIWIVQDVDTQENYYIDVELSNGDMGYSFSVNQEIDIVTFWLLEEGCTNENSCNYNASADLDDGSCIVEYLDCDGNCNNDTDSDGICDEIEVVGCTSQLASNYNSEATDDDGSCIIWGCTNQNASNYNSLATVDNTSCVYSSSYLDVVYTELDSLQNLYNSLGADYDVSTNIIDSLGITISSQDVQIEEFERLTDSLSSPIQIDLVEGWNMIGYTMLEEQDVVATFNDIVDYIIIMKNNEGAVYMPEFGFNGIGDLMPGQGYQIKLNEAIDGYVYPNTDGLRMNISPTIPQWAIDMEVEMHPNDIRTLVRVVNMLGQEVNPKNEPNGSSLLYIYNDGTVEKKLNH